MESNQVSRGDMHLALSKFTKVLGVRMVASSFERLKQVYLEEQVRELCNRKLLNLYAKQRRVSVLRKSFKALARSHAVRSSAIYQYGTTILASTLRKQIENTLSRAFQNIKEKSMEEMYS